MDKWVDWAGSGGKGGGGEVDELKDFFAQTHTLKLGEHNLFDSDTLKTFNFQLDVPMQR